jgi:hypothetical protein
MLKSEAPSELSFAGKMPALRLAGAEGGVLEKTKRSNEAKK